MIEKIVSLLNSIYFVWVDVSILFITLNTASGIDTDSLSISKHILFSCDILWCLVVSNVSLICMSIDFSKINVYIS